MAEIRNCGAKPLFFKFNDGEALVLEPGAVAFVDFSNGRTCRLACDDCGLADGSHHTWCGRWRPYEASE
jgi:hypothetical protein